MPIDVSGVLPVFQTPFRDDAEIDEAALAAEFDWIFGNGADGVVFAMVSEVLRMDSTERDKIAALVCESAAGRGCSVISVGAESTIVAVRHAKHAQACGASAVMAMPPALFHSADSELLHYFLDIAAAVEVPLIVQDASGYVGAPLSLQLQVQLQNELGDRVMFKPEAPPIGPRLSELQDATSGKARVFEGTGGLHLIDSFRRGIVGTMPAADMVWALVAMWRALTAGNFDHAYRIAGPLALIMAQQTCLDGFIAVEKNLLVRQGVLASTAMRGPTGSVVDSQTSEEIGRLMNLLHDAVDNA